MAPFGDEGRSDVWQMCGFRTERCTSPLQAHEASNRLSITQRTSATSCMCFKSHRIPEHADCGMLGSMWAPVAGEALSERNVNRGYPYLGVGTPIWGRTDRGLS